MASRPKTSPPRSPAPSVPDEKTVEFLVNQAFRNSDYFNFAKWVLVLSLGLVGAGSLTVFGLNIDIAGRMMKMREDVQKVDVEIKSTIADRSRQLDQEITNAKTTLSDRATAAGTKLQADGKKATDDLVKTFATQLTTDAGSAKERIETLERGLTTDLNQRQSKLGLDIKAEQDRLDKLVARVNALESNLGPILAAEAELSAGTTTNQLRLIGAVLERAAACLLLILALTLISAAISVYCLFRIRRIERRT